MRLDILRHEVEVKVVCQLSRISGVRASLCVMNKKAKRSTFELHVAAMIAVDMFADVHWRGRRLCRRKSFNEQAAWTRSSCLSGTSRD